MVDKEDFLLSIPAITIDTEETRDIVSSYDPYRVPRFPLEPIAGMRQDAVSSPPHEMRSPAIDKYPRSTTALIVPSGTNRREVMLGFACRSIVVQNVTRNQFLFCPELAIYLTSGSTYLAAYNLQSGMEKITLEWHTALFDPTPPTPYPNEYATLWLYDEWVPPVAGSSGGGGGSGGNVSSVASSATSVTLLASNAARKGATIYNESTAILYLKLGATASLTSYSAQLVAGAYYELPFAYTGIIDGIWASANGNARITEIS